MRNQFFYNRRVETRNPETEETTVKLYKDSFNINKVIRSIELIEGGLLVLLDDIHQRKDLVDVRSNKGNKTGEKFVTNTYQSEITLSETEDIEKFRKLLDIYHE